MSSIEQFLWTEKYRPTTLEAMGMSEENRGVVEASLAQGEVPHLLLHGPPGCGKTTLAFIVRDLLDCEALVMNASKERGIDVVRDKIGTFVRGRFGRRWNLVILDEADYMTKDAQTALRNMMETYSDTSRFILTANYPNKIIDALHSRCTVLRLDTMDVKDRARVLVTVLLKENVQADPEVIKGYAERYTDLRRMLSDAQKSVLSSGEERTLAPCKTTSVEDGKNVLALAGAGDYAALRTLAKDPETDHAELLRSAFWAVEDSDPKAASLRVRLAQAYDASPMVPDPVVHFLGVMAEFCQ